MVGAAVRYFKKTVDLELNPYGIDEDQIYFGGNSAGGVIAVHAAFMQEEDINDAGLLEALETLGGIEGDSGNEGYSSEVRGAISLAGAVANVDFISLSENDKLLISCHGDQDGTVPYLCGQPLNSAILPELCGGGAMWAHTEAIGFTNHQHLEFQGSGHVPWEFAGTAQEQMIDFVSDNLYAALDCMNIGVDEFDESTFNVYPNPTKDVFSFKKRISLVNVYNLSGVKVLELTDVNAVDIAHLVKGIYLVELINDNEQARYTRVVKL